MNKKGFALESMYPAVLTIVLIGIVLGVGIYVLEETSDAMSNTQISITNESITFANGSTNSAHFGDCGADNFLQVGVATNATADAAIIDSGNYTFNSLGTLTSTAASEYAGLITLNISYTYDGGDTSTTGYCGVLETSSTGIGGFASWIAVIVARA